MENNGRTFYYQIDLWISNRGTYCRGLYGRRALSAVNRTVSLADIREYKTRARLSHPTPPLRQDGKREERARWTGEKAEFRIVWGYYFMEVPVLLPDLEIESILNYLKAYRWIEVACVLSA